jgi:hypothetical protein
MTPYVRIMNILAAYARIIDFLRFFAAYVRIMDTRRPELSTFVSKTNRFLWTAMTAVRTKIFLRLTWFFRRRSVLSKIIRVFGNKFGVWNYSLVEPI